MCYFAPALDPQLQTNFVRGLRKFLSENKIRPRFIVGRGLSGASMGAVVANRLRKALILVRKPNDGSHAWDKVEGFFYHGFENQIKTSTFIIIDDLIESGKTITAILSELQKRAGAKEKCAGVFCYNQMHTVRFRPEKEHAEFLKDIPLFVWRCGTFEKWDWQPQKNVDAATT